MVIAAAPADGPRKLVAESRCSGPTIRWWHSPVTLEESAYSRERGLVLILAVLDGDAEAIAITLCHLTSAINAQRMDTTRRLARALEGRGGRRGTV